MQKEQKKFVLSPYLIVILSFVGIILLGSFLLCLPFAHKDGQWGTYIDALFTATSATCVTGLSTYINGIGNELTIFGQVVVLIMIEVGGLGFITFFAFFITIFMKKLKFSDRLFLSQAVNSDTVAKVGRYVRRVVVIVITCVVLGFLLGLPVFLNIKQYSLGEALWACFFHSASAFNNAGFDLFGATSLLRGVGNEIIDSLPTWAYYYLLSYTMVLIILGGISFMVIIEIFFDHRRPKQWSSFTRIVLLTTAILLVFGFGAFVLTDVTSGNITVFEALFQSVTTRTAGFAAFDQTKLSVAGKTISNLLMFIGGSPLGTAGGIKTTTIFMIVLSFICFIRGRRIIAFNREYTRNSIIKAMSLVFLSIVIVFIGNIVVESFEVAAGNAQASTSNVMFEVFSAYGTVGLSCNLTPTLTVGSKIALCILMFFGRLGPITMFQIFQSKIDKLERKHFEYIQSDVIIG